MMNAFTCTGSYAVLILYGIKRTENRSAWPEPRDGGRVEGRESYSR